MVPSCFIIMVFMPCMSRAFVNRRLLALVSATARHMLTEYSMAISMLSGPDRIRIGSMPASRAIISVITSQRMKLQPPAFSSLSTGPSSSGLWMVTMFMR